MCLKNVKSVFLKSGSITAQLTLFYSTSTCLLILAISLFFYWAMLTILYKADEQFLSDEVTIIRNILDKNPNNSMALKQEIVDIPHSLRTSFYHYYVRVLDQNKHVIAETGSQERPAYINPLFNLEPSAKKQSLWWESDQGNQYALTQTYSKTDHGLYTIQIALDVSYQQQIINQYRQNVLIVIFGGTLVSIVIGYFLAHRGLRRLDELTETTKNITMADIHQRIKPKLWPKELKELAKAYNQMLDRIEESIKGLTELSDNLAHELRAPITNLMGEAELALSTDCSVQEYQGVIESHLEELTRINQLVDSLLFLARAENPQMDLQKSLIAVDEEIKVMCRFYQALADEKNIQLICEGNAMLEANPTMFRRMIGNLLSNSIKYSANSSVVCFTIKKIAESHIEISLRDQGTGIAAEDLPKLFQRFYRGENARNSDSKGIGLGLAIVQSIVDLHQGLIKISSVQNEGTSVIIHLPVSIVSLGSKNNKEK